MIHNVHKAAFLDYGSQVAADIGGGAFSIHDCGNVDAVRFDMDHQESDQSTARILE